MSSLFGRRPRLLRERGHVRLRVALVVASLLGWFLTLVSLQSYLDFSSALRTEKSWMADDMFFVTRDVRLSDTLNITSNGVNTNDLEALQGIEGVESADFVRRNTFNVAIIAAIGPMAVETEVFLESLPDEVIKKQPELWDWKEGDPVIPMLIPRYILNLYNFGYAPGKGMPPVSEGALQQLVFDLIFNPEIDGGTTFKTRVVGFSDQLDAIVVPDAALKWANENHGMRSEARPRRLVVVGEPDPKQLTAALEGQGLRTASGIGSTATLRLVLDSAFLLTGISGLVILGLNILLQWTESEAILAHNEQRIFKLYTLGYPLAAPARRLIAVQLVSLAASVLVAVILVAVGRAVLLARFFPEGGIGVSPQMAGQTLLAALGLFLVLGTWLSLRILGRLRSIYCG